MFAGGIAVAGLGLALIIVSPTPPVSGSFSTVFDALALVDKLMAVLGTATSVVSAIVIFMLRVSGRED